MTLPAFLRWLAGVLSAVFSNLCSQAGVLKSAGQRGGPDHVIRNTAALRYR